MRIAKNAQIFFILVTFGAPFARSSTIPASSCTTSAVQTAISSASSGDTVTIPAGNCTWSTGVTISHLGITILGAGIGSTTIVDNAGGNSLFNVTVSVGQTFRISSMTITAASGATNLASPILVVGTCSTSSCSNLRVDTISFTGWSVSPSRIYNGWLLMVDDVFGVADHNTVTQASGGSGGALINVNHSAYLGVGQYGDNSWAQPDSFGTNNAFYMENNTLTGGPAGMAITDCDHSDNYEDIGGCRMVVRYNTLNNAFVQTHGTESTDRPRGARQLEVYGNTFNCSSTSSGCDTAAQARSGVVLNFSNTYSTSAGAWFNSYLELNDYRTLAGFAPWGYCAGQGPYDQNDGTVYASGTITSVANNGGTLVITDSTKNWSADQWTNNGSPYSIVDTSVSSGGTNVGYEITDSASNSIGAAGYGQDYWNGPPVISVGDSYKILRAPVCLDQPSRSGGTLLSGGTPSPTGWVNEVLDPSYEWNDTLTAGSTLYHGKIASDTARIIANRDYYYQGTSFNGTTGTGVGVLSGRPSSCTSGVAYWATDKNTLYQCKTQNTWVTYYTPYAYPHPLLQGGGGDPPAPPSNLQAIPQ